jgi:exodeoxyribonuclease VII large subunit
MQHDLDLQAKLLPTAHIQEESVLSVAQLSNQLKRHVESGFASIKVRGEISGLKVHTSGHSYFCLKDQDAVLDAVCWRGTRLSTNLLEGAEVVATGRITTYPGRSKYQMVVSDVRIAGEGALLKLLLDLKTKLQAEGLFDHKKKIPPFPKRIGVVTSPTGAVIQDILHRISDRYPCHVLVWPVLVQGPGAADQIAAAIQGFNQFPDSEKPDVLIVARGGGSLEDLWAFNEESVVRAASQSIIPLISAVGHETDTTLIDFASDQRAPTPTAAAEFATPVLAQVNVTVQNFHVRQLSAMQKFLETWELKLGRLSHAIPHPQHVLEISMQRLDDWAERLHMAVANALTRKNQTLRVRLASLRAPSNRLQACEVQLEAAGEKIYGAVVQGIRSQETALGELSVRLEHSSFKKILGKGFCLTQVGGKVLTSAEDLKALHPVDVTLQFHDGVVQVRA